MSAPLVPDALRDALRDRYAIERELGHGGMATVYLAHDVRHDRKVALKLLREELSASLGKERFLREIKVAPAAAPAHPAAVRLRSGRKPAVLRHALRRWPLPPRAAGESRGAADRRSGPAPAPKAIVPADSADFATLFGNATFQREPAVLVLLERELGSKVFQRALREYVARHRGGTVSTDDFRRAAEQASGRSLDAFFARWVRGTDPLPPLR